MQHKRKGTLFVLVMAALAATVLAACSGPEGGDGYPNRAVAPEKQDSFAPDFKIVAYQGEDVLGGREVFLSHLFGRGKPVVLNFWAGVCPPCRAEMPDLEQVYQQYKDRVFLLGLDVGPFVGLGSREDGRALVKELQVTYPVGTTFDAEVVSKYQILGMPTTVFIKPDGKVVRTWVGLLTRKQMVELVEELLAASSRPKR